MAKRSKKKKVEASVVSTAWANLLASRWALPLLLGIVTVAVYSPSLRSDFVFDARADILMDPFPHTLANLPTVLSLKVLSLPLWLASRPMQLLFIMANWAVWGNDPFGFHLSSILLHSLNVALLCVILRRLLESDLPTTNPFTPSHIALACATTTLWFAIHPVNVESVAEVSYSSTLLVMLFTLTSLLGAMAFKPGPGWRPLALGTVCTVSAFAAVASKESGIAACLILLVYWQLFRREESKPGWIALVGLSVAVTGLFLIARFTLASPGSFQPGYLGGSLEQAILHQPRLWVFMMDKLAWPTGLSADYQPINVSGLSSLYISIALPAVLAIQAWLARKSRVGAMGVAFYWLGLATVSNLVPLFRPLGDRFYYLPMAGLAMQMTAALFLLGARFRPVFSPAMVGLLIITAPLTLLTIERQSVFANSLSLWTDTFQVSPTSLNATDNLGFALYDVGDFSAAQLSFKRCIDLTNDSQADPWMGMALSLTAQGRQEEAVAAIRRAIKLNPIYGNPHELERQFFLEQRYEPTLRNILTEAGLRPQ